MRNRQVTGWIFAGLLALGSPAISQSSSIENDHLVIRDGGGEPVVDIGSQVIVDSEIRVVAPGPDLQSLVDSLTDAGPDRPYLIRLGPGRYVLDSPLALADYVSLAGSGQEVTSLIGSVVSSTTGESSALLLLADHLSVTDLTVENLGGDDDDFNSTAIWAGADSPLLRRVSATASQSGTDAIVRGIESVGFSPRLEDVTATAKAPNGTATAVSITTGSGAKLIRVRATATGRFAAGVNSEFATSSLIQVEALATGTELSVGVNAGSGTRLTQVVTNAQGTASVQVGVRGSASAGPMTEVTASSAGSTAALWLEGGHVRDSTVLGGLEIGGELVRVRNSRIVGGVTDPFGTSQCSDLYDDTLADVTC